jgi:hypothetical protein
VKEEDISWIPPPEQENDPHDEEEYERPSQDRTFQDIFFLIGIHERPDEEERDEDHLNCNAEEFIRDELQELIGRKQVPRRTNLRRRFEWISRDMSLLRKKKVRQEGDDEEHNAKYAIIMYISLLKKRDNRITVGMVFLLYSVRGRFSSSAMPNGVAEIPIRLIRNRWMPMKARNMGGRIATWSAKNLLRVISRYDLRPSELVQWDCR